MLITVYTSAQEFLHNTQDPLERNEAANNLMLGIAFRLAQSPAPPAQNPPYLATASDGQGIAAMALMTPPHNLVVYSARDVLGEAPGMILRAALDRRLPVPGVLGPQRAARAFAQAWAAFPGHYAVPGMHQRVYELEQVIHPHYSPGHLRPAGEDDIELVTRWAIAFHEEARVNGTPDEIRQMVEWRVGSRDIFLWDDGRPASMATRSRPISHSITVSLVYTPPKLRRHGYATSCVAALSQSLLDSGWQFCTLFTNLANPTSNDIYQQIGYRPVCDYDEYILGACPSA